MRGSTSSRALLVLSVFSAVIAVGAGSAHAQTAVIYEGFDYPDTELLGGQDGGTGFVGPWANTNGDNNPTILAGSIAWGDLPTSGNYAHGAALNCLYRPIGTTLADAGLMADGATLWFSYVEDTLGQNMTNLDFNFALATDPLEGYYPPQLSYDNRMNLRNDGFGIGVSNSTTRVRGAYWQDDGDGDGWGEVHRTDTTLVLNNSDNSRAMIVGKIEWGADAAADETITLYAPGTDLVIGDPILELTTPALDQSLFDTLAIEWKDTPSIDEIRFGATYESAIGYISVFWDLNGTTAGAGADGAGAAPGIWDATATNWNPEVDGTGATDVWTPGSVAAFAAGTDATGTYEVTVNGQRDIRGLSFEEGTVTLLTGTDGALRMIASCVVDVASGATAIVATPITEDATPRALTKKGDGTLTLSVANTYTGPTTVNAGRLNINAGSIATLNVPAGRADLNSPGTATTANVSGTGLLALGGTVGELNVTGGTVNVNAGATATTATLSGGTVNAGSNALAVTDTLTTGGGYTVAYTAGGAATSFTAGGANIRDDDAARTITLSGGTLTVSAGGGDVPAGYGVYYDFEDAENLGNDVSDKNIDLAPTGDAVAQAAGVTGSMALDLTAQSADDGLTGDNGYFGGTIMARSYSFWLDPDGLNDGSTLYKEGGGTNGVEIRIDADGFVDFHCRDGGGGSGKTLTSSTNVGDETGFTHVVVIYDNDAMSLYINGGLEGSLADAGFDGDNLDSHATTTGVGINNGTVDTGTRGFDGLIDDFVIWDKGLTPAEVTQAYKAGFPSGIDLPNTAIAVTSNSTLTMDAGSNHRLGTVTLSGGSQLTLSGATTVSFSGLAGQRHVVRQPPVL